MFDDDASEKLPRPPPKPDGAFCRSDTDDPTHASHILFNSLAQALAAAAASDASKRKIVMWSPPGAGSSLGPAWVVAIVRLLAERYPALAVPIVLDCADEAGTALGALRSGISDLSFSGSTAVAEKLQAMGARLWRPELRDPLMTLELTQTGDPVSACRKFLPDA